MPSHETLAHNHLFGFLGRNPNIGLPEDEGCELPDLSEPFAIREEKAVIGMRYHMQKPHVMEIRCCHPTRRQRSTSTILVILSRKSKKIQMSQIITVKMQFLTFALLPSLLMAAQGCDFETMVAMMRCVAGPHWYPKAYDPLLRKM
jgi:hypothetical protein